MERKLVSIQTIDEIAPIEGADRIMRARVMGWDVVVKKGEFEVGSKCVFFEIDSVLPDGPAWAEFMRVRKFRVKTMRLRGVLSQGLALPISILETEAPAIGTEVRTELGVTKYEPELPSGGIAGPFPARVPKTDEIRLQSALAVLDEISGHDFAITVKLDGTSVTFFVDDDGLLAACSRNWSLARGDTREWKVAERHGLESKIPRGFAVQGELCGPGIQKNRLGLSSVEWFVFDAYDTRAGKHLGHAELVAFCTEHGLPMVPIDRVVIGDDARGFDHSLQSYLAIAGGRYAGTSNRREGIVIRPLATQRSATLSGRLSFKVISNDFLLEDED